MLRAPPTSPFVTAIKQEPRHDDDAHDVLDVQVPTFDAPWIRAPFLHDLQPPFVDLFHVDDDGDDDANDEDDGALRLALPTWSPHRPRGHGHGLVGSTTLLEPLAVPPRPLAPVSLSCAEGPTQPKATRLTSPVATSDLVRLHAPAPLNVGGGGGGPLDRPISPTWGALRLKDTMPDPTCSTHGCKHDAADDNDRCKRHQGGRTCKAPGCTKNSQGNGLCIRHGGGRRCGVAGCPRGAQARGKCKSHGGGVRCKAQGCTRSSQGSGLCRTHGGGKLCDFPGCKKGTQRHGKCSTHGGARLCRVDGCEKVDRGGGLCGRHKLELLEHRAASEAGSSPAGSPMY